MKVMKLALLGTAALAAASLSARADDLSDLKAQIEALNSRIASLEAAPAVPAGYQLMTFSKAPAIVAPGEELSANDLAVVNTIGILPTADVPASTSVSWNGHVKAAFVYTSDDYTGSALDTSSTHIEANTEINLKALTDTPVGEVGVHVRWGAAADGNVNNGGSINRYYGWWRMTPELSLTAGYKGTIGGVGHGNDKCNCNFTSFAGILGGTPDASQFEVRYASGPIEAAIAVEHHSDIGDATAPILEPNQQTYAVSGELKYAGDSVSAEIAGFFGSAGADSAAPDVDDELDSEIELWQIGAGATFSMDMITLSAAAGVGGTEDKRTLEEVDYMKVSLFASAALSDSISAELGVGYEDYDSNVVGNDFDVLGVAGGVYWSPADKLTIGAEASYKETDGAPATDRESFAAALVTIFKF